MHRIKLALLPILATFMIGPSVNAQAQDDEVCSVSQEMDQHRLLRRLSLDLNHRIPSVDALMALDGEGQSVEDMVDSLLESDRFRVMARRFHEKLLWPNVEKVELTAFGYRFVKGKGKNTIYSFVSATRRNVYRGDPSLSCLDQEQLEFFEGVVELPGGENVSYRVPVPMIEGTKGNKATRQEGYVWVAPYWAPDTLVKACAYDAQDAEMAPVLNKDGTLKTDKKGTVMMAPCGGGQLSLTCGAGPNVQWAWADGAEQALWEAFREQMGLLVDDHTVGSEHTQGALPYSELLTTSRTYTHGRYEFFKKHLAEVTNLGKTYNAWMPGDVELPEKPDFNDTAWRPAERNQVDGEAFPAGHSGILTLPAYTLRFQTNRGRANHFRTVFTGQYFVPAETIEDPLTHGCSEDSDDLTQRCTCRGCHQVLEPLAAYWGGTIAEAGTGLISDRDLFPEFIEQCNGTNDAVGAGMSATAFCRRFYVTDDESDNAGVLGAYQYAYAGVGSEPLDALHEQIRTNLEEGPAGIAQSVIQSGQFHATMIGHLYAHLLGREMNLNPALPNNDIELWNQLSDEFQSHDSFRTMVRRIVLLEQYRRVQ